MKTLLPTLLLTIFGLTMNGCTPQNDQGWHEVLASRMKAYGHRNWIVVADAAYPSQSRPGVETIATNEDQIAVLKEVLNAVRGSKHVRAHVFVDKELAAVTEQDAPGIDAYRSALHNLMAGQTYDPILHEELITKLGEVGGNFDVLILKTTLTVPYTSVFFELGCGYWSDEAERRLRDRMVAP
jgi:hypothetical protein